MAKPMTRDARGKDLEKMKALLELFPGDSVPINGVDVQVLPLKVGSVRKFSEQIGKVMPRIVSALQAEMATKQLDDDQWTTSLIAVITPFLLSDLIGLVDDSCDIDIGILPHDKLPPIIDKWIELSLKPGNLKPWQDLVEGLAQTFLTAENKTKLRLLVKQSTTSSESEDTTSET